MQVGSQHVEPAAVAASAACLLSHSESLPAVEDQASGEPAAVAASLPLAASTVTDSSIRVVQGSIVQFKVIIWLNEIILLTIDVCLLIVQRVNDVNVKMLEYVMSYSTQLCYACVCE